MATFKIGQRVKRIADPDPRKGAIGLAAATPMPLGMQGTVMGFKYGLVLVLTNTHEDWGCYAHTLAPLTDPNADVDAFIENMKRLGNQPIIPEPELVTIE